MARSRNIKPGFFDNEILGELPALTRLLFIGLWCLADREGRLNDRPKRIKKELLGYDDVTAEDVDQMLQQLNDNGFIIRYTVGTEKYIQVINFLKHQNPHCKEQASIIPPPEKGETGRRDPDGSEEERTAGEPENKENYASTIQAPCKYDTCTGKAVLIPDSLNLIPDSLNTLLCVDEQTHKERGRVDSSDGLTVAEDDNRVKGRVASDSMADVREHQAAEKTEGGTQEAPGDGEKRKKSPDWKTATTAMEIRFCKFWDEYPDVRCTGKFPCWEKFKKLKVDDELLEQMLSALRTLKQSRQWQREDGQYIPLPLTWLNQRRWEDVHTEVKKSGSGETAGEFTAGFHTSADY